MFVYLLCVDKHHSLLETQPLQQQQYHTPDRTTQPAHPSSRPQSLPPIPTLASIRSPAILAVAFGGARWRRRSTLATHLLP